MEGRHSCQAPFAKGGPGDHRKQSSALAHFSTINGGPVQRIEGTQLGYPGCTRHSGRGSRRCRPGALIADLQAELDKLAVAANVASPKPDKTAPPDGAQGDAALIHWLIQFAANPAMARVYAQGLVMAINAIVSAMKPNTDSPVGTPGGNEKGSKGPVRIAISGKEIILPVATSAIKAFLDTLGTGHSGS